MKILALETSTHKGGAAVVVDGKIISAETTDQQRSQSELLHSFAENCLQNSNLKWEELDAIAVGEGPGSFTGLRVAANTAKTYAFMLQKPIIAVDSLMQIAWQVEDRSRPALVMVNAFKNMVYAGIYDFQNSAPAPRRPPAAIAVQDLGPWVDREMTVVGNGFEIYQDFFPASLRSKLLRPEPPKDDPTPGVLGVIASQPHGPGRVFTWKTYVPLYLRASEAEEKKRGILLKQLDAKGPVHGKSR